MNWFPLGKWEELEACDFADVHGLRDVVGVQDFAVDFASTGACCGASVEVAHSFALIARLFLPLARLTKWHCGVQHMVSTTLLREGHVRSNSPLQLMQQCHRQGVSPSWVASHV